MITQTIPKEYLLKYLILEIQNNYRHHKYKILQKKYHYPIRIDHLISLQKNVFNKFVKNNKSLVITNVLFLIIKFNKTKI